LSKLLHLRIKNTTRWPRLTGPSLILLVAALATAPLFFRGPSCGHDFDFHLVSWLDGLNGWRHGIPYPHWSPSSNYGAGEPRFVFYPPLTWMLGAALGLILPWTLVPAALTFLLLAATGLATRALALEALDDAPATLAGCMALFSGYALFTAYERTAYGELTGGFWIPLLLLFALRGSDSQKTEYGCPTLAASPGSPRIRGPRRATFARWGEGTGLRPWGGILRLGCDSRMVRVCNHALDGSALPLTLVVAGVWLSNVPVGVMACYLLAAVALAAALLARSWAPLLRAAVAAALGTALAAFYLIPAAWEQRWVDIRQLTDDPGERIENSWLFARHADPQLVLHDVELRRVSILAVSMLAVAFAGLLILWLRSKLPARRCWWVPLALIPLAVLFLQLPLSLPLWNLLPELRFLQFPWRWLVALEAPMALFFAAAVWPPQSARRWLRLAVAALCAAFFLGATIHTARSFFQPCDDEDAVPGMIAVYRSGAGFAGTDEYAPPGADDTLLPTGLRAACLTTDPTAVLGSPPSDESQENPENPVWTAQQGSCDATFAATLNQPEHLRIHALLAHSGTLILRLRSYPAWQIKINGRPVSDQPRRQDGLIAVPVPAGPVDLTVDWIATPDVRLGRWLSGVALLLLAVLGWLEQKHARSRLSL
jgi:hypothetical protein